MLQKSTRYWQALEDDSNIILLIIKCGMKDYFEVNICKRKKPLTLTFKSYFLSLASLWKYFFNQGLRNDFKAAMEKIDQEYLAQLIKQQVKILSYITRNTCFEVTRHRNLKGKCLLLSAAIWESTCGCCMSSHLWCCAKMKVHL